VTTLPSRQRADARLNRTRILDSADIVFRREGVDAPLDTIIRTAGIGKSTFFRHFPDRQSLLVTLLGRSMDELEDASNRIGDDPHGLFRLIELMADRIGLRTAFVDYWIAADRDHLAVRTALARTDAIFSRAIALARNAGLCRDDLTTSDIAMIGRMLAAAVHGAPPEEKAAVARRALNLIREGYGMALEERRAEPSHDIGDAG
jgi:AcrR family transcriptional regulator